MDHLVLRHPSYMRDLPSPFLSVYEENLIFFFIRVLTSSHDDMLKW